MGGTDTNFFNSKRDSINVVDAWAMTGNVTARHEKSIVISTIQELPKKEEE